MKKVVATIFFFIYFITSSGATIQLHYCMDKLVGWSFSISSISKCNKCGMEKKGHKGCCHDENKIVKTGKDYNATSSYFDILKCNLQAFKPIVATTEYFLVFNSVKIHPKINAPPLLKPLPLYISNSVFRI